MQLLYVNATGNVSMQILKVLLAYLQFKYKKHICSNASLDTRYNPKYYKSYTTTVESTTTKTDNPNLNKSSAVSTVDINGSAYALMVSQAYSRIVIFNITNNESYTSVSFRTW